jgi:ribosomal-protein-alanine N-acetyltransferase
VKLAQPLDTPRLQLRCLTAADATERYLRWLQDPEVARYLESRFARHSLDGLPPWIEQMNNSPDSLLLGLFTRSEGLHIGNIKLGPIDSHHGRGDIGLMLGEKSHWGRGYASEAIMRVAVHAFDDLGLRKLTAGCYANNIGSMKAFEKVGFTIEARLAEHWVSDDGVQDGILMGLTTAQFVSLRTQRAG